MLPLNYTTKALDCFKRERRKMHTALGQKTFDVFTTSAHQAEKFILPPGGHLIDERSYRPEFRELIRLPFPRICLEYLTEEADDDDVFKIRTALVAAQITQEEIARGEYPTLGVDWTGEKTVIFTTWTSFNGDDWMPQAFFLAFNPDRLNFSTEHDGWSGANLFPIDAGWIEQMKTPRQMEGYTSDGEGMCFSDEAIDKIGLMLVPDLKVLLNFLMTVNCTNVVQKIYKAPEILNKRRRAMGRAPMYSFRVLTLQPRNENGHEVAIGTHASPRLHMRRGHLRRLSDEKIIWVRHCMVGNPDKGVVEKEYAVGA